MLKRADNNLITSKILGVHEKYSKQNKLAITITSSLVATIVAGAICYFSYGSLSARIGAYQARKAACLLHKQQVEQGRIAELLTSQEIENLNLRPGLIGTIDSNGKEGCITPTDSEKARLARYVTSQQEVEARICKSLAKDSDSSDEYEFIREILSEHNDWSMPRDLRLSPNANVPHLIPNFSVNHLMPLPSNCYRNLGTLFHTNWDDDGTKIKPMCLNTTEFSHLTAKSICRMDNDAAGLAADKIQKLLATNNNLEGGLQFNFYSSLFGTKNPQARLGAYMRLLNTHLFHGVPLSNDKQ